MQRRIGYEIREVQQMIHQKMEQFRHENGCELTLVQTRTIGFLIASRGQDVFQRDLEKELRIRRSTASEILNVLERDGYLHRIPAPHDARLKKLVLTDTGRELHEKTKDMIDMLEEQTVAGISKEDLDTFYRVIDQVKNNVKNMLGETSC